MLLGATCLANGFSRTLGRAKRCQVRSLRSTTHLFGHTHFGWDVILDGIRYMQAPLAYPSEREKRPASLGLAAERAEPLVPAWAPRPDPEWGSLGGICLAKHQPAHEGHSALPGESLVLASELRGRWSEYYKQHPRQPHVTRELCETAKGLYKPIF